MEYEKVEAGHVVIKEGDESNDKMYIILSGEFMIFKKKLDIFTRSNIALLMH